MAYSKGIPITGGLFPIDDGDFPLVNAENIYVDDRINLKDKLEEMDEAIGEGSGNKLNSAAVAPTYSDSSPYSVGQLVTHEGGFYRCNTAIAAPGEAWNAAHWDAVTAQGVFITAADAQSDFVQKETGKGLSSNDFTTEEKTKLAGIAEGATAVTVDSALTQGGTNPVQGGVIYSRFATVQSMVGSPLVAATAADMTDTTKVYVYTGSETGYTNGDWYYYDGSAWADGGVYNSTAFTTDTTLAVSGQAADAKATGDAIAAMSGATGAESGKALLADTVSNGKVTRWKFGDTSTDTTLSVSGKAADAKVVGDEVGGLKSAISEVKEDTEYNSNSLLNEVSIDTSQKNEPLLYEPAYYTNNADGSYYLSTRILKKGVFIDSIKVYANKADANGNVILIDSNNIVVYKRRLKCAANSWNSLKIGIIASDDLRIAISTTSAFKAGVPREYAFSYDGLYKITDTSIDIGDTVTVTKESTSLVGFAAQFKYYEGQPIKDIVVENDTFIKNNFLYSVPNIKDSYSNNSDGSFYISDRIIPENSFITDVILIAGDSVSTDNFIVFFNSDNEVVYVKEYSLALQDTNVISINHLFEEDVHFGVCGSIEYDKSVTDDYRFCLSTGLYKASSNDVPDVGDTISYSPTSASHFGFAIQIKYLHYDRHVSSKSDQPISGYENFSVTVNYADYTADADETPSEYTDYGVIALPSSYSPNGEPTRLVILCGGTGERIRSNTNPLTFHGWNYFLAKGYAVMDVNGMASAWGTASSFPVTNQHYCNKYLLNSYSEAYKYVMNKYNLKHDIFVAGISMGGGAAALIVQSNILPVKANVLFCPALSVFKQDYMHPWNATPTDQQKTIAGQWGFPDWSTEAPSQSYFLANYDKVVGFDNLMIRTFGDVQTALENYGNAAEENAFNALSKVYPVPVKVWHCENDPTVYYRYSQFFVRMIKNAGGQAWLKTYATGGHSGGWDTGSVTDAGVTTSKNFYEAVLFLKQFE